MSVQSCFQSRPHLVWSVTTILFCFIIDCTYTISRDSSVLSSAWTALVQLVTSYFSLFPLSSPLRHILPFNFRLFWSLQSRLVLFFHFGLRWFRSLRLHPIFFRWIWSSWLHPMFPFVLGNSIIRTTSNPSFSFSWFQSWQAHHISFLSFRWFQSLQPRLIFSSVLSVFGHCNYIPSFFQF